MKLIIDIGNTCSKLAVFEKGGIILLETTGELAPTYLSDLLEKFPEIHSSIISGVKPYDENINTILKSKTRFFQLDSRARLPFRVLYKTPGTLGKDRIAAVAGAMELYPGNNVLVIDAGTCITYDILTSGNEYLGGAISPGIMMRFKSLNTFTGNLPLIQPEYEQNIEVVGNSTKNSILSGVQKAVVAEVEGMIEDYKNRFPGLKIIITGGDYKYFDRSLKNNIFAAPNLVLTGLNKILDFNEKN
ncbi:MAG: type III pantothenate kinase [Chlorobi bacterium]|nr:type III pantothenate kinase [Chlorobiota bacterium]